MPVERPPIIVPSQWGARPPKQRPRIVGRPVRIIEHHTAGHGPFLPVATDRERAIAYARVIQRQHMDVNGWNDSGHSFLVMRSGIILVGRWGTLTAIQHGRMVESAHCPGQNDQPGIEHEHKGAEGWTVAQWDATVHLQAWIASRCGIRPTELEPHSRCYATACPSTLGERIPELRAAVATFLNEHGRAPARTVPGYLRARLLTRTS